MQFFLAPLWFMNNLVKMTCKLSFSYHMLQNLNCFFLTLTRLCKFYVICHAIEAYDKMKLKKCYYI